MSYDMSIGDREFNYTYNVAPMWYAAQPEKGIRAIYGLTGEEAGPILLDMMKYMSVHWSEMVEIEPESGWGDAKGAFWFLMELHLASMAFPREVWVGD